MNVLDINLAGVLAFTVSPLELMRRGTLMYWLLFIVLRFVLRRDVGSLGISDFLFVVILVQDGKLLRRNMRRKLITEEELKAKIRQEGIEDLAKVKRMYLEADGEMSLIRHDTQAAEA